MAEYITREAVFEQFDNGETDVTEKRVRRENGRCLSREIKKGKPSSGKGGSK